MTRIALASAAMLLAMGSAFAGSDHYGDINANQSTVGVDSAYTASVRKHEVAKPAPKVDSTIKTGASAATDWPGPPADNWGN
ncbi:MAG: DUF680 domain-containing protein [Mesorhizobium sp.]|uniref:DUF680 domain-containing protein n=1 Tax=Mesorhizobium sp. TaxID=1871066 RepID=UPI000FE916E3|nr:DUF680 domain-containing protein [Mesorhizobium sp.]RWL99842.1 MAG: DUF680 domain-containing protein [Mesorhizobium sp.]TIP49243.1 MAG: DUF680 domain-containing protein [Mesorhizobium sp.]